MVSLAEMFLTEICKAILRESDPITLIKIISCLRTPDIKEKHSIA